MAYLAGGYGNLLAQIFRRNFPNYSAGLSLNIPLRNRAAQSDYVTSLLEIRQNEFNLQKNINQVRVDVQNAVIGLQQARARYDAAVKARELQQQTLEADQRKYELGRRDRLSGGAGPARSGERPKLARCRRWRTTATRGSPSIRRSGTTLEANNISLDEAMSGRISRPSALPANLRRECSQ